MNIPSPSTITSEQAQVLNLIKNMNFVCGQNTIDRPVEGQTFAIVCVVPCKDAIPDASGNFAFAKVRGVYSTLRAAEDAAEEIVRTQDQLCLNSIVRVGKPYPIRLSSGLPESHTIEIDIRDSTRKAYKNFAKSQREEDERIEREIMEKAKIMQDPVEHVDDEDDYCLLRSKLAHWTHMIDEFEKNKKEVEAKIIEGHRKVLNIDEEHPDYQHTFLEIIKQEEARSGFELGKTEQMDKMLEVRWERLTNYKKFVEYLFPNEENATEGTN
jgi:hypothetical protein